MSVFFAFLEVHGTDDKPTFDLPCDGDEVAVAAWDMVAFRCVFLARELPDGRSCFLLGGGCAEAPGPEGERTRHGGRTETRVHTIGERHEDTEIERTERQSDRLEIRVGIMNESLGTKTELSNGDGNGLHNGACRGGTIVYI